MKAKQLKSLAGLTQMVLDAEMAALKSVNAEFVALQSDIDALRAVRRRRGAEIESLEEIDPAQLAGADRNWETFERAELGRLNIALAKVAAQRETQASLARKAFGRDQVMKKLIDKSR